ncbi:MAG: hypothetical protein J5998_08745 [Clostridia bacterium]|nr:hypothetical protein [Clostridia bacterium]
MNRRLANPFLDERKPGFAGRIVIRVLLIAALVSALLITALLYLPGERLLVWYWVYIAGLALPIIFLLGALTVKLYQIIRSRIPRLIVTWLSGLIVLTAAVIVYSLCSVYAQVGATPAAYYTNPGTGNRLVIMKAVDFDNSDEAEGRIAHLYGAFPMSGKFFYYPERGDMMETATGIDYVEWADDGMSAAVHIRDREGVEKVISVGFDFSVPVEPKDEQGE